MPSQPKTKKPKAVKEYPLKYVAKLKNPLTMFDLCISTAYFAGKFDLPAPIDETREVFEAIKKLL